MFLPEICQKELNTKINVHKKIKTLNKGIKELQTLLPKIEKPKKIKEKGDIQKNKETKTGSEDIESQLQEIQNKLRLLQE